MRMTGTLTLLLCTATATAQLDWTTTNLHLDHTRQTRGNAAHGSQQAGSASRFSDAPLPVLWSGSHQDWIDLTPAWAFGGTINAMSGTAQVGQVIPGPNLYHAGLWYGSPESAVDLHPLQGYRASEAYAVAGSMQVGIATHTASGALHASLWTGTAESFVSLHPAGSSQSRGLATDGTLQGGWASLPGGGESEAVIWAGSAESIVNLAPPDADRSRVNAMAPGIQVGSAEFPNQAPHAAIWRGTAASFQDVNPIFSGWSELLGTDGTYHVGQAYIAGFPRAHVWMPDGDIIDLHAFLPPNYTYSEARDVYTDGNQLTVIGIGAAGGDIRAWMWTATIPAPGPTATLLAAAVLTATHRKRR